MTLRKIIPYKENLKINGVWTNKFSDRNSIDSIDSLNKIFKLATLYPMDYYKIFSLRYADRFNRLIIKIKLL